MSTLFRSRAPLRIGIGGGGTDCDPYRSTYGGICLNATINKYVYVTLQETDSPDIEINSLDFDTQIKFKPEERLAYDGNLDLVKAVINHMNPHSKRRTGYKLWIQSDVPPGSGLGTSSSLCVALLKIFDHYFQTNMDVYELMDAAIKIERYDLKLLGGFQDQVAAAWGGINFIEFTPSEILVTPLRLKPATLDELENSLMLVYTGKTHVSEKIIEEQNLNLKNNLNKQHFDDIKGYAKLMKRALLRNKLYDFAQLLDMGWQAKKQLAQSITNPEIDKMYEKARRKGVLGGKMCGAGAGGFLLLFTDWMRKAKVAEAVESCGGIVTPFKLEWEGAKSWTYKGL